jgi:hypothetical protein
MSWILVKIMSKNNFLLQIRSHVLALRFTRCHIVSVNKNETKENEIATIATAPNLYQSLASKSSCGVVINALYPSSSLKYITKESKLQPPTIVGLVTLQSWLLS